MSAPNTAYTVNHLIDVVIFAYEASEKMVPVTISELKAMLPICNRPMIWYCIQPLIQAGFTNFYICVNKDYEMMEGYLRSVFQQQVQFHFVIVSPGDSISDKCKTNDKRGSANATMCEAVRCFLKYKAQLPAQPSGPSSESSPSQSMADFPGFSGGGNGAGDWASRPSTHFYLHSLAEPRDALLLDCDTVLCNIDMENFAKNFYFSLSSVTMMLMRPIEAPNSRHTKLEKERKKTAGGQKGGGSPAQMGGVGKGKGGGTSTLGSSSEPRKFEYEYSCVVYEEEEDYYKQLNQDSCINPYPVAHALGSPGPDISSSRSSMMIMGGGTGALGLPYTSPSSGLRPRNSYPRFSQGVFNGALPTSSAAGCGGLPAGAAAALPLMISAASSSSSPSPPLVNPPLPPHFHRLHVISPPGMEMELNVTLQYVAKRPHLRFERGVVNPQVYMVRHWVLHYMAETCDKCGEEDADLQEDPIPFLSRSQHTLVNTREKMFMSPDQRIGYTIPTHWFFQQGGEGRQCPIASLCARSQQFLPAKSDHVRVSGVIYEESTHSLRRIYRIHSWNNYLAANEEIVATRAAAMRLNPSIMAPPEVGRLSAPVGVETTSVMSNAATAFGRSERDRKCNANTSHFTRSNSPLSDVEENFLSLPLKEQELQRHQIQQQVQRIPFLDPGCPSLSSGGIAGMGVGDGKSVGSKALRRSPPWTFRQQALSLLQPDIAITMLSKVGGQGLHIRDSFLRSVIPPNTFVTRCAIGPGVTIGSGARLTDSVIMAEAEIGEGAQIIHSIIGKCVVVNKNVKLENCVVESAYEVKESAKDLSLYWV